jgi:hypothetical protein
MHEAIHFLQKRSHIFNMVGPQIFVDKITCGTQDETNGWEPSLYIMTPQSGAQVEASSRFIQKHWHSPVRLRLHHNPQHHNLKL